MDYLRFNVNYLMFNILNQGIYEKLSIAHEDVKNQYNGHGHAFYFTILYYCTVISWG
jgi:hypothetical protein